MLYIRIQGASLKSFLLLRDTFESNLSDKTYTVSNSLNVVKERLYLILAKKLRAFRYFLLISANKRRPRLNQIKDIQFQMRRFNVHSRIRIYLIAPVRAIVTRQTLKKDFPSGLSLLLKFEEDIKLYCAKFARLFRRHDRRSIADDCFLFISQRLNATLRLAPANRQRRFLTSYFLFPIFWSSLCVTLLLSETVVRHCPPFSAIPAISFPSR